MNKVDSEGEVEDEFRTCDEKQNENITVLVSISPQTMLECPTI